MQTRLIQLVLFFVLALSAGAQNNVVKNPKFTGAGDFDSLSNKSTVRSQLGLAIGTNVQAFSSDLTDFVNAASWSSNVLTLDSVVLQLNASSILRVPGGSSGAPGVSFFGDNNTGFFSTSPDTLGITLGGSTLASFTGSAVGFNAPLAASSYNGLTITSSTGTLTIANGKTLTASNTLTLAGTDGSTLNISTGGTLGTAAFVPTGERYRSAWLPKTAAYVTATSQSEPMHVVLGGDSEVESGNVQFITAAEASWGIAGGGFGHTNPRSMTGATAIVGSHPELWFTGSYLNIPSGESAIVDKTGGAPIYGDTVRVTFIQVTGATSATATIQISTDGGSYTTAGSTVTVNGTTQSIIATRTTTAGNLSVKILASSAAIKVADVEIFDSTKRGAVIHYIARGGYGFAEFTQLPSTIYQPYLAAIAPKLLIWRNTDLLADQQANLPTHISNLVTACGNSPDVQFISLPPIDNNTIICNAYFETFARANNYAWLDVGALYPTMAEAVSKGLSDDAIHPNAAGFRAEYALFFQQPMLGWASFFRPANVTTAGAISGGSLSVSGGTVVNTLFTNGTSTFAADITVGSSGNMHFKGDTQGSKWLTGSSPALIQLSDAVGDKWMMLGTRSNDNTKFCPVIQSFGTNSGSQIYFGFPLGTDLGAQEYRWFSGTGAAPVWIASMGPGYFEMKEATSYIYAPLYYMKATGGAGSLGVRNQETLTTNRMLNVKVNDADRVLSLAADLVYVGVKTVGTLPSAATAGAGAWGYVTDANSTTIGATVAGGGSSKVRVWSDGTNWIIG